ncbi:MAG TPA: polysaccharide biosynthesis protein, partial [Lysobacter sp.]|nr:polysaccharide biosynthesis protein [Lysobacter sp.]
VLVAAALAGVAVWPLRGRLPPLMAIAVGGGLLAALYFPLSLLLGCWNSGDIRQMQQLHDRFGAGRPRAGARLLEWALARTEKEPGT